MRCEQPQVHVLNASNGEGAQPGLRGEEEKRQATHEYNVKNKRGLTSQANLTASKAKPPMQSGKAIFKSKA